MQTRGTDTNTWNEDEHVEHRLTGITKINAYSSDKHVWNKDKHVWIKDKHVWNKDEHVWNKNKHVWNKYNVMSFKYISSQSKWIGVLLSTNCAIDGP